MSTTTPGMGLPQPHTSMQHVDEGFNSDVQFKVEPHSMGGDPLMTGMTGTNPNQPSKPLRRACDCCRKRKVKCDGSEPCGPCKKASIRCAYLQPPKKKGPKGLRSARVLHALRRIDDTVVNTGSASPASPLSPAEPHPSWPHGTGWPQNWQQTSPAVTPSSYGYTPDIAPSSTMPASIPIYGRPTSMPQSDGTYFPPQSMPTSIPTSVPSGQQPLPQQPHHYQQESMPQQQSWGTPNSASASTYSDQGAPNVLSPATTASDTYQSQQSPRLSTELFQPYIQLFFQHMFPIMPVIDKHVYLDPNLFGGSSASLSPDMYSFLCAICAATIVQLDASIPQPPPINPGRATDDVFAEECLRERKSYDYIESASTLSVMTSFFLFAYYGNHEQHLKAWHYLQECITFSEHLNMDSNESYAKLPPVEAQWRRRLYWLLFITERAYAVQRRRHCRLHRGIDLPSVFDSEDPQLLTGFNNLANLFSAVDDQFVAAWRSGRKSSLCNEDWLQQTQKTLDATVQMLQQNGGQGISETQHLDISITREWLHVLTWQMGVSNGLIWQETGNGPGGLGLDYPIELARKVVELTSGANRGAIDAHGIGMEQKLSDIAGCLADVLKCTAGDTSSTFYEGKQYLAVLLHQLSSIRGKESRYLQPLMSKTEGLMGYELAPSLSPPGHGPGHAHGHGPVDSPILAGMSGLEPHQPLHWDAMEQLPNFSMGRGLSVSGGVNMLRRLSLGAAFAMPPGLAAMPVHHPDDNGSNANANANSSSAAGANHATVALPATITASRRPSGRVFNEEETDAMGAWATAGVDVGMQRMACVCPESVVALTTNKDMSVSEIEFLELLNNHLQRENALGDVFASQELVRFTRYHRDRLSRPEIRAQFQKRLAFLLDRSIIDQKTVDHCLEVVDVVARAEGGVSSTLGRADVLNESQSIAARERPAWIQGEGFIESTVSPTEKQDTAAEDEDTGNLLGWHPLQILRHISLEYPEPQGGGFRTRWSIDQRSRAPRCLRWRRIYDSLLKNDVVDSLMTAEFKLHWRHIPITAAESPETRSIEADMDPNQHIQSNLQSLYDLLRRIDNTLLPHEDIILTIKTATNTSTDVPMPCAIPRRAYNLTDKNNLVPISLLRGQPAQAQRDMQETTTTTTSPTSTPAPRPKHSVSTRTIIHDCGICARVVGPARRAVVCSNWNCTTGPYFHMQCVHMEQRPLSWLCSKCTAAKTMVAEPVMID